MGSKDFGDVSSKTGLTDMDPMSMKDRNHYDSIFASFWWDWSGIVGGQMGSSDWRVHLVPKQGQRFQRVYGQGARHGIECRVAAGSGEALHVLVPSCSKWLSFVRLFSIFEINSTFQKRNSHQRLHRHSKTFWLSDVGFVLEVSVRA